MMWFTAKELIALPVMPTTPDKVKVKLDKLIGINSNLKRKRKGSKAFEYHLDALPDTTKTFLMQKHANALTASISKAERDEKTIDEKWYEFDNATTKQKSDAEERLKAALLVRGLVDSGKKKSAAIQIAVENSRFSYDTIRTWFYKKPGLNKICTDDWLPNLLLLNGLKVGDAKRAEFSEEAQQFFKNSYLRPHVTKTEAYRATVRTALANGWKVPSIDTVKRWCDANIPYELKVLLRDGKAAVNQRLVPAQRRTRMGMHALEMVSGDGHVARVQCELENGKIIRPMVWVFQDVYSSAIVGYSVDISENNEMLSIAIANMAMKYGLPRSFLFDRGSAALSDQVTGSMVKPSKKKGKYKKFDSTELEGLLQTLGYSSADINWTGVIEDNVGNKGNARGKPVERAFHSKGGIGQFERHPSFEGCYTGSSVVNRPMDYEGGKKGVSFNLFCELFDDWVIEFNNVIGRRTEMGRGVKSYQEVFDESYAVSQIRKPTPEQLRLCLLNKEMVMVRESGVFELMASKYKAKTDSHYKTNRYQSPMLYDYIGERITIRFNPYDMHSEVYAYDKHGRLIGAIQMIEDAGFRSLSAKRMQALHQSEMKERVNLLAQQADLMDSEKFKDAIESLKHDKSELGSVVPGITEMIPSMPKALDSFINTSNIDETDEDDITSVLLDMYKPASNG